MNPRIHHTAALAGAILLAIASPAAGQLNSNLGGLTAENAKGYLSPLPEALSSTLNSSIFQGASIPMTGFHISFGIHAMGVTFDDDLRTYHPTDPPGFTSTAPVDAPTVIGSTQAVDQPGQGGTTMSYPGGVDINQFVIAVPQLQIGNVLGTRAVIRYIAVDLGDSEVGDFSLFGIGAQHSLSRYFPDLPVDLAAGAFYQTFQLGKDELIDTQSFQLAVTASKNFGYVEPYASVGYDSFSMETSYESTVDPGQSINVKFDDENNMHFTGGVLFGFPFAKLFAEFNVAAQTSTAVGIRFGN